MGNAKMKDLKILSHSIAAALDQLRVIAISTKSGPDLRNNRH